MITLEIKNIETDIRHDMSEAQFHAEFLELRKNLRFRPEGYLFSPQFRKKRWDGWKCLAWKNKSRCYFPTGLFSIVKDYFKEKEIPFQIIDKREKPNSNFCLEFNQDYKLRDYQQRALDAAVSRGRGIIHSSTGSGKTIIGSGIIHALGVSPFLFLVTSIDLLEQTKERLEDSLLQNGSPLQVGSVGGGNFDIRDINVMTVQTAVRALGKKFVRFDMESKLDTPNEVLLKEHRKEIVSLLHATRAVISDEIQHWRSDICQIVMNDLKKAYYRYGLSATPFRDQGDDLLIQACFGKKICEISASELIQKGFLVQPTINFIHLNPPVSKYKNWQSIYKNQIVENDYYNNFLANLAEEYIKNESLVLVLVQQIEHGKLLEDLISGSLFVYGNSPKKERLSAIKKLKNRYIKCIISTSLFDEGIDCKPLDVLILGGGGKSPSRAMQRVGRVLRPFEGKEFATVIDPFVHEKYLEEHANSREKMYKTEKEFIIKHHFPE